MLLGGVCGEIPPLPGASKGNGFVIGPRSGPHPPLLPYAHTFTHVLCCVWRCPCGDMYFWMFIMPCVMMLHTRLPCRVMHVYISFHTVGVEIPSDWRGRLPAYINEYSCMCPPSPLPYTGTNVLAYPMHLQGLYTSLASLDLLLCVCCLRAVKLLPHIHGGF